MNSNSEILKPLLLKKLITKDNKVEYKRKIMYPRSPADVTKVKKTKDMTKLIDFLVNNIFFNPSRITIIIEK